MKYSWKDLWQQLKFGAINGFFLAFLFSLIIEIGEWRRLYFKLNGSISYFEDAPSRYNGYLLAPVVLIIVNGVGKVIAYFLFRTPRNIFVEWQVHGEITIILLYLYAVIQNLIQFLTGQITFQQVFQASSDRFWWVTLLIFTLYNFAFACVFKLYEDRFTTKNSTE